MKENMLKLLEERRTNSNFYQFNTHANAISNIENQRIKASFVKDVNDCHELLGLDFDDNFDIYNAFKKTFYKDIEIPFLSFSRSWGSPLMWGHYSDNNKGICLGFEINTHIENINYSYDLNKYKINLDEFNKPGYLNDLILTLLKNKSIDWWYEQESRLQLNANELVLDKTTSLRFHYISDSLKLREIIIGSMSTFKPKDIKLFLTNIDYPNDVSIFKTMPSLKYYLIDKDIHSGSELYEAKK